MALPDLETPIWPAKGIAPSQTGDMVYSAGDQPIAPYDNRAMWNLTTDIHTLHDELGAHVGRHETGGDDELDLQNLRVNGVAALNADTDATEIRWVDPATSTTATRLDVSNSVWRQTPDFADAPRFNAGFGLTDDIDDTGGTLLYDSAAGDTGKFHHAKEADHALEADWADVAGALEDDSGNQYQPGDFLTAGQDATITGSWTYDQTISGDIDGNAATADHATTADSATTAGHADTAGNSDKLDGYEAQELIDTAKQSGEWQPIGSHEHATVGEYFDWTVQSDTTYDLYRAVVYAESHRTSGYDGAMNLRVGVDGTVDSRYDYQYYQRHAPRSDPDEHFGEYTNEHFNITGAAHGEFSVSSHIVACPRAVTDAGDHYPTLGSTAKAGGVNTGTETLYGSLERDYATIDTFRFFSPTDQTTGRALLYGRNL